MITDRVYDTKLPSFAAFSWLVRDGGALGAGREQVFRDYFSTASAMLCSEIDRLGDPKTVMAAADEDRLRNTFFNLLEAKRAYQEESDMAKRYAERKQEKD